MNRHYPELLLLMATAFHMPLLPLWARWLLGLSIAGLLLLIGGYLVLRRQVRRHYIAMTG